MSVLLRKPNKTAVIGFPGTSSLRILSLKEEYWLELIPVKNLLGESVTDT